MQLAIIIPVFRTPRRLADLLGALLADPYPHKQIVVAVDGPLNPEIAAALEPFRGRIRVEGDGEHRGKSQTLNRLAPTVAADVFVFLDNDVAFDARPDFLSRLAGRMQTCDLLELPKQADARNWLSDLVAFEFLDYAILAWLFTRLAGHCPAMNGAAFAVRKEWFLRLGGFRRVMHEDIDFAARAFREWARYGFEPALQVRTEVPLTLPDWFRQRKRWALNNLFWLKENLPGVLLHALQSPRLFLSFLIFFLPFLLIPLFYLALRSGRLDFLLPAALMLIQHVHGLAGVFLTLIHVNLYSEGRFLSIALALAFSFGFHYAFARGLRFRFKFRPFFLYYFIYSPVWILVNLFFWLRIALLGDLDVDWKT